MATQNVITELLQAHRRGDRQAADRLFGLVYDELHALAHRQLRRGRPGQTLNTTALVHEAYLKMVDRTEGTWHDKAHFMAVSAMAMRQILVDYARRRQAEKRGGQARRTLVDASALHAPGITPGSAVAFWGRCIGSWGYTTRPSPCWSGRWHSDGRSTERST